jgi:hypothetical protein
VQPGRIFMLEVPARIVGVGGSPPIGIRLDAGGAAVRSKTGTEGGAGG